MRPDLNAVFKTQTDDCIEKRKNDRFSLKFKGLSDEAGNFFAVITTEHYLLAWKPLLIFTPKPLSALTFEEVRTIHGVG